MITYLSVYNCNHVNFDIYTEEYFFQYISFIYLLDIKRINQRLYVTFTEPFITQLSQLSGGVSSGSTAGAIGGAGAVASGTVPSSGAVGGNTKPLPLNQRLQLQREPWFHGAISRKEAEMLLVQVQYINYQ